MVAHVRVLHIYFLALLFMPTIVGKTAMSFILAGDFAQLLFRRTVLVWCIARLLLHVGSCFQEAAQA